MNKNTIIGSVLIGAIMIWWFFMNSANNEAAEKAKLAQKAAAKEAAVQVADSAEAPSANGLVLPGSTAEVKAAPVLGAPATDKVTEPAEVNELEDELPCFSALLNAAGSLFSADADDESSHAAKNATMQSATKIFFIKILRPNGLIFPAKYSNSPNLACVSLKKNVSYGKSTGGCNDAFRT